MEYQNILVERNNGTVTVIINRPDKLNALNKQTLIELDNLFNELKSDSEVGVVILSCAGEKAFVSGADISELNRADVISGTEFAEFGQSVFK